jgi:hypothetical protein
MAEIKRVSDQYKITAPSIVLDGNVQITGSSTAVDVITSVISDTSITLNAGETGAGVSTLDTTAQIIVDRGSLPDVAIRWNEATDQWQITTDGSTYSAIQTSSSTAGGSNGSVQYNDSGALGGDINFTWDGFNLNVGDITINSGSIGTNNSNSDLEIYASGAGAIHLRSVVKLENELSDPTTVSGNNLLYAKTPNVGNTGLFFANTTKSDELVSKSKAVFFGLIL